MYLFLNLFVVGQSNKTDIWGHIGGLIAGTILTLALCPVKSDSETTLGDIKRLKYLRYMGLILSLFFFVGIGVKLFII